ncbi:MAG: alpha/beta hydrolase [Chloroflexota bacterium]|nr:alpha/beta hydrolase [Chloroflexota bacterium]
MEHIEGAFKSNRDLKIYYQGWLPETESKAVIIIVHGLGEHSERYDNVVNHFVRLGYAIYGFDLPGHGKSGGEREFIHEFKDYSDTLTRYKKMVKKWQPDKSIFILGHSMGGLIVTEYLIDHSDDFQGAVISAPAITIPDNINPLTVFAGKVFSKIVPKMGIMALDPNLISRDEGVVEDYIEDPLVFHGKTTARLSAEMLRAIMRVNDEMREITAPLIVLQGSEDKLVNPQGSKMLYEGASSEDKTLKIYDGLFHEVFNEPEREKVLTDVASWLNARL